MKPLRHIADYLRLAARSGSRALERACAEGNYSAPRRVTLPSGLSGWRFTVWSQRGSKWSIWIEADIDQRKYLVHSRKVK